MGCVRSSSIRRALSDTCRNTRTCSRWWWRTVVGTACTRHVGLERVGTPFAQNKLVERRLVGGWCGRWERDARDGASQRGAISEPHSQQNLLSTERSPASEHLAPRARCVPFTTLCHSMPRRTHRGDGPSVAGMVQAVGLLSRRVTLSPGALGTVRLFSHHQRMCMLRRAAWFVFDLVFGVPLRVILIGCVVLLAAVLWVTQRVPMRGQA